MGKTIGSIALALLIVVGFVGFVATNAVGSHVQTEGYYKDALANNRVFDRMYDELLVDPKFAPQVDELLGGVNVKRTELVATMKQLVTPERLQEIADELIKHLVSHFGVGDKLELTFDITPIVEGIHDVAIRAAVEGLKAVPTKQSESYEQFIAEFTNVVQLLQGEGELPDSIPTYPIPEEDQDTAAGILVQAAGLDENDPDQKQVIDFIRDAIAKDDVALAIRVSAAALLEKLIDQSIMQLTSNEYVSHVDGAQGTRFLMGPGAEVTKTVDEKLELVKQLSDAAKWVRLAAAGVIVLALVGLVLMHRKRPKALCAWTGAPFVIAGVLMMIGWVIVDGIVRGQLGEVAQSPSLPPSFQQILKDVLESSIGNLSSSIWIPSIIATVVGAVLIAGAFVIKQRSVPPPTPPQPPPPMPVQA